LEAGVNHPAWSPDNQWIAFNMQVNILSRDAKNQFPYGLYIARPDGTDRRLVTQDTDSQVMGCNQWAANGNLAYVLFDITDPLIDAALVTGDLYIYQPSTGTQTLALKGIPCPFNLSPDGRFLAFVKNRLLTILPFESQQPVIVSDQQTNENLMVGWTQE
jgi:Tol biopolymer transport system component